MAIQIATTYKIAEAWKSFTKIENRYLRQLDN